MPTPDERSAATAGTRMPKALAALAALAGLACLACCLIPVLLTAGVLGGGWIALGQWMPALALALAAAAAGRFWVTARRRRRPARCRTGCTCGQHVSASA